MPWSEEREPIAARGLAMKRLGLLLLLFLVVALDVLPGEAQQPGKVYRVGFIPTSSPKSVRTHS